MTQTHELGHLVFGWLSGATLTEIELRPWRLPYTIFQPDPHPLFTLWGGPLLGALMPLTLLTLDHGKITQFVAYFCLLANGSYLALAWCAPEDQLDTVKLLEHGAWPSSIAAYCLITITLGYWGFRRACIRYWQSR